MGQFAFTSPRLCGVRVLHGDAAYEVYEPMVEGNGLTAFNTQYHGMLSGAPRFFPLPPPPPPRWQPGSPHSGDCLAQPALREFVVDPMIVRARSDDTLELRVELAHPSAKLSRPASLDPGSGNGLAGEEEICYSPQTSQDEGRQGGLPWQARRRRW